MSDDGPKRLQPNWLTGTNQDKVKRSKKHEERISSKMGGYRLPASGALKWSKYKSFTQNGDIATPDFHIEHKRTDKKSISVKKDWLEKVSEGATRCGKDPALVITFEDPTKPLKGPEDWIMVPLEVVRRLLDFKED